MKQGMVPEFGVEPARPLRVIMTAMHFRNLVWGVVFAAISLCLIGAARSEESLDRLSNSFQTLAEKVSPAVVQIIATGYGAEADTASGGSILERRRASGSGVVLDAEGYIVTNGHVVGGARKLQVLLAVPISHGPGKS